jgi:type II secretion system protein H
MTTRNRSTICRQGRPHGFTLMEIMLVLVILAIFTGAVTTNMHSSYLDLALDTDANMLADFVNSAQQYSRAHNCVCRMTIDPKLSEYYLSAASTLDQTFQPVYGELGSIMSLNTGIAFVRVVKTESRSGSDTVIHFFPDGRSESVYIVLTTSSGYEKQIEIESLFGRPRIH